MRLISPCVQLLAVICAAGLPAVARSADTPTVAVVDFISTNGPVDSVILGAADLLEVELGRYDIRVISRRELNLLRGERGLARSGYARIEDFQGGALPWADFLLRGEYQFTPGESGVRFRLVDAATGTERGSWDLRVERPADLAKNLEPILPRIMAAVCGGKAAPPRPRDQTGFTTIPEAASTFYHGLDHLVFGRPEYAAEYFRIAAASDTNFSLAVLAQAKAYEQLGFPGVAVAVRATIPAEQLPQAQTAGTSSVLTVRFVSRSDTFTAGQMQRIRDALKETHGFALFEPDWIPALTRETDLKLSQDFPLVHGLDHRLWLRADHFIVFGAEQKGLSASVIDLARGELLGTVAGGATDLESVCAQAVALIREPGVVVADLPPARAGSTNEPTVKPRFRYSVDEVAFALRRLADRPKDLACWVHLLCVMQPERLPPEVYGAFLDAHEAAIPPDAPDAPVWLASALWARYQLEAQQADDVPDIESRFAPLVQRYPGSLQAQVIRYHIARFLAARGELPRSLSLAVEAADQAAPPLIAMDSFIPLRGQYLDCIEQVDYEAFPNAIPPSAPWMAMLARDMFALAAYLSALTGDATNAQGYLAKAAMLDQHPRCGAGSIYPLNIGVWQTGHIGYSWKPPDPADDGRVQVGWTFLPCGMPSNMPTATAALSADAMLQRTREVLGAVTPSRERISVALTRPPGLLESEGRSAREIWQGWMNACTNTPPMASETAFLLGVPHFAAACRKACAEPGSAPADFAGQALAEFRDAGPRMARDFGEVRSGQLVMRFSWLAAHHCLEAGEPAQAWAFTQRALAWRGRDDLKFSLRYQSALAAWASGHDDAAALMLRTLAGDPRAKDLTLILPYNSAPPRSVYLKSVELLEKVRSGPAPDRHPADIDLTPVKPYYVGSGRPGVKEKPKKERGHKETWGEIMAAWAESMEKGQQSIPLEDLLPESYEPWPEDGGMAPLPARPRFGEVFAFRLEDEVGIEFVWIESMQLWAARYELTEQEWCYVMTETETGGRLPRNLGYKQALDVCAALNKRAGKRLPEGYCYRIPTVEEWERLARSGTDRIYPWGNTMPPTFGNYGDETVVEAVRSRGLADHYAPPFIAGYRDGYENLAPVEDSGANDWGLYGMGGNLWDWATAPNGKPMTKGATFQHSAAVVLRVDAGCEGGGPGGGATLRCVLAREIKPETPVP